MDIYFSDFFNVSEDTLSEYGAFNISLINDLPLFIDPFLLFNSENARYQSLHTEIIRYLRFLRDKSSGGEVSAGLIKSWFTFSEVKQNWLGYSLVGNAGSGLGAQFAHALNRNLHSIFADFGQEKVTEGSHLEKLTLIEPGVGRDNISDFTTNLIKAFLLEYTQSFARNHLRPETCRSLPIQRVEFNYSTQVWQSRSFYLPWDGDDYVILTPKDLLTKDENWINRRGLVDEFDDVVSSVADNQLRAEVNNYFLAILPDDAGSKEEREAKSDVISRFPALIEYYIRYKEDRGDEAEALSDQKVAESEKLYIQQVRAFAEQLREETAFYEHDGRSYGEARARVLFLKDVIENKGGHHLFMADGEPIRRESDLQILFRLTWFATPSDVSREVNDGRGPADFKISRGALDKSLVEFKLASNSKLRRNLEKQVEIYKAASDAQNALKVVIFFSEEERDRVASILNDLEIADNPDIILIDARPDNKPSGSRA